MQAARESEDAIGRLFLLGIGAGRVLSVDPDGSHKKVLATRCRSPDGVPVDVEARHTDWTSSRLRA